MKTKNNILSILLILITSVFSCSSDDDASMSQNNLRLKVLTEISNGGNTFNNIFEYTDTGNISTINSDLGPNRLFEYDAIGNLLKIGDYSYTYNSEGQVMSIIKAGSAIYAGTITYDNSNRISTINGIINNSGSSTLYNYDITYNAQGQIILIDENITGRALKRNLISYDDNGNISEIIRQKSEDNGVSYITDSTIRYTYDEQENYKKRIFNNINLSFYDDILNGIRGTNLNSNKQFNIEYYNTNNIISVTRVDDLDIESSETRTITYNNSGYPVTSKHEFYLDGFLDFTTNYEFTYETF